MIRRPIAKIVPRQRPTFGHSGWRINFFILVILAGMIVTVWRLFGLTFIDHESFVQAAKRQYSSPTALISGRGNIYFSDYSSGKRQIAATNKSSLYLFANGRALNQSPAEVAEKLAPILGQEQKSLETKISQAGKNYRVISTDLTLNQADQIKKLKIKGIDAANRVERYYPLGSSTASLLGFVGFDGNQRLGQYGIEGYYDDILSGGDKIQRLSDNKTYARLIRFWNFITGKSEKGLAPERIADFSGSDVILTIDSNIQAAAESKLGFLLEKWQSPSGLIVVQDPNTGKILAAASSPSFNPNQYFNYDFKDFINPIHQEIYEPGSSFKPITMAAALGSGAVKPETTYRDSGQVKIGDYTIKNFDEQSHGTQTMRQVLEKSLNLGAIFAQERMGDDAFLNHVVAFGFGQKTGVDLIGEISGNISNLYSGRKINFATASFGQGIAVTPLQLINAFSAIANGGKLMWPHAVKEIIHPDGSRTEIKPKVIGSPIKEGTAKELQSMLVSVVDRGFDKARVKGYDIAGKTGTAQIPSPAGGYFTSDQFIHNFVGFAPAFNPRFSILIKIDRPRGIRFAADSLSPTFGDLTRYLIRYFNIPPTRN